MKKNNYGKVGTKECAIAVTSLALERYGRLWDFGLGKWMVHPSRSLKDNSAERNVN